VTRTRRTAVAGVVTGVLVLILTSPAHGQYGPPRRSLFHGRKGELRQAYREGMEDQLGALGLTLWNTVYLYVALARLGADGYPVRDEDIACLSPYVRRRPSGAAPRRRHRLA